jgi:hypothetical protein
MSDDLSDATRRAMQRAGVHFMKAAIEVVEGISVFLEELARDTDSEDESGPEKIEVE